MPEMDGAVFLEQVKGEHPDVVRILLTGYSDLDSTIAAINKGKIFSYIAKPWDNDDLKQTLHQALHVKLLGKESRRLEPLTQRQNEELKSFK